MEPGIYRELVFIERFLLGEELKDKRIYLKFDPGIQEQHGLVTVITW